jgi:hypothetical protein
MMGLWWPSKLLKCGKHIICFNRNCSSEQIGILKVQEDDILQHPVLLTVLSALGAHHPSTCNSCWCFLLFLLSTCKYPTCFGPTGHLQMYNLICRSFKVNATVAGNFLGWYWAPVHVFHVFCFRWSNFLTRLWARRSSTNLRKNPQQWQLLQKIYTLNCTLDDGQLGWNM